MAHEAKLRQVRLQPADFGSGRIVAAVVDIDDLIPDAAIKRCGDLGDQRGNVAGLVLDRNDNRQIQQARQRPAPHPVTLAAPDLPRLPRADNRDRNLAAPTCIAAVRSQQRHCGAFHAKASGETRPRSLFTP
jgi:hypothetical protein